jgi:ankyrin repeat protein
MLILTRLVTMVLVALVSAASLAPAEGGDDSMLYEAASDGDIERVRRLLAAGAPVDMRDGARRTPLLLATQADHVEVAKLLIEAGADVNAKDTIRDTPFLYAGAEGRDEILRHILATGKANLKDTNRYGGVALIPAAHHGHPDTVRILLQTDIDVNHVNNLGWTALLEAVILGDGGPTYSEIVRLLVDAGARPTPDRDGVTPLDHARSRGFSEIASLLEAGPKT